MLNLTYRYVNALLDYVKDYDLDQVYRQAFRYVILPPPREKPAAPLGEFLELVPREEWDSVVESFLDRVRDQLRFVTAEIISAVPLTQGQLNFLEVKLIRMFRKQLDIVTTVDPSLLGGLRIIVGDVVLDDSIKRKLSEMKSAIYKGVYYKQ